MTKVSIPTSKMALTHSFIPPKRNSPKGAKTSTIDIFTKLFAISIVASSFWGFLSSCTIVFCPFSSSSSSSVLDKEKSAVSDPDIRAEQPNKKININALMIKSAVGEANN